MPFVMRAGYGLCFLLYPVLLLSVRGGMNGLFFLASILSLVMLFRQQAAFRSNFDQEATIFSIAMASSLVAILLSQVFHQDYLLSAFDSPSRFLFAILIFISLRSAQPSVFVPLQYGFPLGAIAAACVVLTSNNEINISSFIDRIHLGNFALLLGLLSVLSIRWTHRDSNWLIALKLLGLAAGVIVSILTGKRGGWVAIPFVFLAWLLLQDMRHKIRWLVLGVLIFLAFMATVYHTVHIAHYRIDASYNELINLWNGQNYATSAGVRLQQWQAAWQLFLQNPFFGVGGDNIGQSMIPFQQSGLITKQAADVSFGELHSDIISYMTRFGLFGLLSVLSLYLVPLSIFIRSTSAGSRFQRTAGIMGACFVVAFFVFGLTVENFNLRMIAAFYAMSVAVLLAAATNRSSIQATASHAPPK